MAIEDVFWREVKKIPDTEIRDMVTDITNKLPNAFWFREASTKYHHEEEQGEQGNLIHSLRVSKIIDIIYPGLSKRLENGKVVPVNDPVRYSLLKGAGLLHDGKRHGKDGDEPYTAKDHASIMGNFILDNYSGPKASALAQLIMAHMGQWDPSPVPIDAPDKAILHFADNIAASPLIGIEYR